MLKAYDTFLQMEVFASEAARNGNLESYRYICASCGQDVSLAAVDSEHQSTHFRHLHGNRGVECDEYYGQGETRNHYSRLDKNARAEFYFDKNTKLFYLGLSFSDDELSVFEEKRTVFELGATPRGRAFLTIRIDNNNFIPDVSRMIPIERFAHDYHLSNTFNDVRHMREVFKINGDFVPTFFRIQGNDVNYRAKLVRSNVIYTNVPYFIAYQGEKFPKNRRLPNEIAVDEIFRFETMGRRFLGKTITITSKTAAIDYLVKSWGYQLKASETLTLLWPPAVNINEVATVRSSSVHLFSSFSLEPYGNINIKSRDIGNLGSGVSRVMVNSRLLVRKDNAEITIVKNMRSSKGFNAISIKETQASLYTVPEQFTHFLFNSTGCMAVSHGQPVYLTPGSLIRKYLNGYLVGVIYPKQNQVLSGQELLDDLLMHYKRVEELSFDTFSPLELSEISARYIERCIDVGFINSAAKYFIEEGRL